MDKVDIKANLRCLRYKTSYDEYVDPFYHFQEAKCSKGKLLEIIADEIHELIEKERVQNV